MSIPVEVPGWPFNNTADNSSLIVNTSVPVPASDIAYGGTPDNPVYFFNRSLGTEDMVCGTSNWTAGRSCCPLAIGIPDPARDAVCRFRNSTENSEYWRQCTEAVGGGAFPIESRCWPFTDFLAYMEKYTARQLGQMTMASGASNTSCSSVEDSKQWNYTAICCEQVQGETTGWSNVQGTDKWSALNCLLDDTDQQSAFNSCITQNTWAVCNTTNTTKGEGGNGSISTGTAPSGTGTAVPTSGAPSEVWVTRLWLAFVLASAGLAVLL